MKERNRFELFNDESGASLVELSLVLPIFILLLVASVDFGQAYFMAIEVAGAAHAGAVYGSQNPTDTAGIKTAAQDDAPNVPSLTVQTPTYGCECADGTHYSASCTVTPTSCSNSISVVYRVYVSASATYTPILKLPWASTGLTFTSTASMRSAGS